MPKKRVVIRIKEGVVNRWYSKPGALPSRIELIDRDLKIGGVPSYQYSKHLTIRKSDCVVISTLTI